MVRREGAHVWRRHPVRPLPGPCDCPDTSPISQLCLPCTCDVSSFELTRSTDLPLAHSTINMHVANESGFAIVAPVDGARPRNFFPDRSPSWQKIGLLLEMLESGVHDAVLWTDADAAFTPDAGRKLRRLLREHPTADAIFGTNRRECSAQYGCSALPLRVPLPLCAR